MAIYIEGAVRLNGGLRFANPPHAGAVGAKSIAAVVGLASAMAKLAARWLIDAIFQGRGC
jgi:hypothetical protein